MAASLSPSSLSRSHLFHEGNAVAAFDGVGGVLAGGKENRRYNLAIIGIRRGGGWGEGSDLMCFSSVYLTVIGVRRAGRGVRDSCVLLVRLSGGCVILTTTLSIVAQCVSESMVQFMVFVLNHTGVSRSFPHY